MNRKHRAVWLGVVDDDDAICGATGVDPNDDMTLRPCHLSELGQKPRRFGFAIELHHVFAATRPEDVYGSLPYQGPPKTLEDMEASIVAEAKRRHARD